MAMKIKKGDIVQVMTGDSKYHGKRGKVLKVIPNKNQVIVEGIRVQTRHTKPNQAVPDGGRISKEGPIHISNVMFVHSDRPVRIGFKILDNGKKVRYAKQTGEIVD